jgi:hypothetical protein
MIGPDETGSGVAWNVFPLASDTNVLEYVTDIGR